jgi:hypothetical protein
MPSDGNSDDVSSTLTGDSDSIGSSWLTWTQVLKATLVLIAI